MRECSNWWSCVRTRLAASHQFILLPTPRPPFQVPPPQHPSLSPPSTQQYSLQTRKLLFFLVSSNHFRGFFSLSDISLLWAILRKLRYSHLPLWGTVNTNVEKIHSRENTPTPSQCKCIALFLSRFIQHKLSRPPPKCWLTIYFNMTSNQALKMVILLLNAMNAFINLRHSYIQHTAWKLIDWETQWLGMMMAHFD